MLDMVGIKICSISPFPATRITQYQMKEIILMHIYCVCYAISNSDMLIFIIFASRDFLRSSCLIAHVIHPFCMS